MRVFRRIFTYMRPYLLTEIVAYACMLGINGVRLYQPQLIERVVDVGIEQNQPQVLLQSVLLLIALTGMNGVLRFGVTYLTERVSQGIAYKMRNEMYRKLQSLSFAYHDRSQAGQLLSRTTSDVERIRRLTGRGILGAVDAIVLVVGTTIILFRMNTTLAALSLLVMPVIMYYVMRYVEVIHPMWHKRQDQVGVLTTRLEQNLRGLKVVRGFAQEPAEIARFHKENDKVFDISMFVVRRSAFSMPLIVLMASASAVMILWLGGRLVISGQLTLGELIAFNTYAMRLIGPMRRIGFTATMIGESQASADRVFEVLDAESQVSDAPDATDLGDIEGKVEFDNVSFAYQGTSVVLKNVSFAVQPGSVVALLGPTGSGKTTITNLIPRFYDASEGAIRIDDIDVRSVTLHSLRRQIGIVLQETTLFGTTIRENIAFGRPHASMQEIEQAARAAAAHEFIMDMPDGYDTPVGERGITLSGGQRQRVAIARALLLDPRILILDDATSSVDTDTEQQIQRALANLMEGRTSFIIAQRVSTVRNADQILVIDRGRLVAAGHHEDLIHESGIYSDIYHRQLRTEARPRRPAPVGRTS